MTELPTGKVVTFLFTDIQGSTAMWERDAKRMQAALARHDEIMKSVVAAHGGHVFKMVGDACYAAFSSAPDALRAGLAAQRAIFAEPWDERCRVRVRMALHTGPVEERGGDYFGPSVNRVARLLSAGHGGQTLLSGATQELVRDRLPEDARLRDMGERRLKDLVRPERVFQLVAPDLPGSFPPLKTLDARANNLPAQPTALVGRGHEVSKVCGLLRRQEVRLLTLTGPGGTGKTRLALQAAAELVDEYEQGVFFVALAPIGDPALVASTVAGALGVVESAERTLEDDLKEYLRDRELLLLLDNFEQVLGTAALVGELLAACPKLKVVATSRAVLRVYGEHEHAVPPLELPDLGRLPPVEALARNEAVRLFVERARAVKAGFSLTEENAHVVAGICRGLDGLPLAIELAAARIKLLAPQAMLDRLGDRLKLLRGGARDLPERQRTLRGAMDWSHDLLDEGERTLFARLAVFAGSGALEAVEEVCDLEGELDVLDGLGSLLDKSLLRQEEGPDGEPRFGMLETIHEYARERLEERGEADELRRRHAEHFLALAEEAERGLKGAEQVGWLERLEAEHDNLRAALSWALERGEAELVLRLGGTLGSFWNLHGNLGEGRRWLEGALTKDGPAPAIVRARALNAAGALALEQGDLGRAAELLEEGLALGRGAGDEKSVAYALAFLGSVALSQGDFGRATTLLEEGRDLFRGLGDAWGAAYSLVSLGGVPLYQGNWERVNALLEEAAALYRELGDGQGVADCLNNQGLAALLRGDHARATVLLEECLTINREKGGKGDPVVVALNNLGHAALLGGDPDRAADLFGECLVLNRDVGDKMVAAECMEGLAGVAAAREEARRAARLWGAAEALRETIGAPSSLAERALREPHIVSARARLDEASWTQAWAEGRRMTPGEAVACAVEGASSPVAEPPAWSS